MGLLRTVDPAIEPVSDVEVAAHLRIDEFTNRPTSAPTAALASPAAPSNVDDGAHRYRVTFVTADGETDGGPISAVVTVTDKTVNGTVVLTAIPTGGSAVTARKVYRTAANRDDFFLVATIANNTATTYTDTTADASLGVGIPLANTTADVLLAGLIGAARQQVEEYCNRALVTQTWRMTLDRFPRVTDRNRWAEIRLPRPNLVSVTSITYIDANGDTQTVTADDYIVDTASLPGRIVPAYGVAWPATRCQPDAVTITFTAGYGATADTVPASIRAAVLLVVGDLYKNREAQADYALSANETVHRLLGPYSYREIA